MINLHNYSMYSKHIPAQQACTFNTGVEPLVLGGIDAATIIIDHVTFTKLISPSPVIYIYIYIYITMTICNNNQVCQCIANLLHSFHLLNNCQQFSDTISIDIQQQHHF